MLEMHQIFGKLERIKIEGNKNLIYLYTFYLDACNMYNTIFAYESDKGDLWFTNLINKAKDTNLTMRVV